jgi:hypothetical protein
MTIVEVLWVIEQIKQVKARYFRLMDTKCWSEFAQVISVDAVFGTGENEVCGRQAVVELIRQTAGTAKTVHHGHTPEIVIDDPAHAHGTWAMHDRYMERPTDGAPAHGFEGFGFYEDTYDFDGQAWRISASRLRRLGIEPRGAGLPAFYQRS